MYHTSFLIFCLNIFLGRFPESLSESSICCDEDCTHQNVVDDCKHKRRRSFAGWFVKIKLEEQYILKCLYFRSNDEYCVWKAVEVAYE